MRSSVALSHARLPACTSRVSCLVVTVLVVTVLVAEVHSSVIYLGTNSGCKHHQIVFLSCMQVWPMPCRPAGRRCIVAAATASSSARQQQQQQQQEQQHHQQLLRSEEQQEPKQEPNKQPGIKPPLDLFIQPGSKQKGSSNKPPGDEEPPPPSGPNLPPQLQQLLALLIEFGGKLGTAAVLIAWFTHIDPFGGLHWDQQQVLFGLGLFLPLMLFDAALMLPDYTISDPQEQRAVTGLFVGEPQVLSTPPTDGSSTSSSKGEESSSKAEDGSSSSSSSSNSESVSDAEARRMADAIEAAAAGASPGAPVVIMQQQQQEGVTSDTGNSGSSAGLNLLLRLRVSLGLLQQVYTRANPGIGLNPASEFVVVLVATLADEMLYRAVALTLLGLWIR
jgi:hypothetical protein